MSEEQQETRPDPSSLDYLTGIAQALEPHTISRMLSERREEHLTSPGTRPDMVVVRRRPPEEILEDSVRAAPLSQVIYTNAPTGQASTYTWPIESGGFSTEDIHNMRTGFHRTQPSFHQDISSEDSPTYVPLGASPDAVLSRYASRGHNVDPTPSSFQSSRFSASYLKTFLSCLNLSVSHELELDGDELKSSVRLCSTINGEEIEVSYDFDTVDLSTLCLEK